MNSILLSIAYIKDLLDNPNIELIEVWDKILYARMKKGRGRNKFISKKGLNFLLPTYYVKENYRNICYKYHPDRAKKEVSQQNSFTKLSQNINISKSALAGLFTGRRHSGISFAHSCNEFTRFTSTKSSKEATKLKNKLREKFNKNGFSDDELFGEYRINPFSKDITERFQELDNAKEIPEGAREIILNSLGRIRETKTALWEYLQESESLSAFGMC